MTPDERIAAMLALGWRVDVRDRGHDWRVMLLRGVDVPRLHYGRTREAAIESAHADVTRGAP